MIGTTLSHYKILEKIGSGGMGDVYLAEDTRLARKVALKVLPPELAESEQRRARFKREAQAIAALDHPNIVQVFSVEEAEGTHFITMQLVQGKTLTELLPKNGFPLNKFFDIAIPLTDAVAAAHQAGITHRDLKPDNMMVGDDGRVKVLDFGLAKPTSGFVSGAAESALPTMAKTAEGVIVGTLNYMSPEQAQGKTVDARSDIFSLGVVLYEMLTARRPFGGDTPAEVLSSIIKDTPPSVAETRPELPRELSKIVQRCLAKEPTRRLQSVLDVRNELEELKADLSSGELQETVAAARPSVNKWLAALAVVSLVTLAVVLVYLTRAPEETIPRLVNPVQMTSAVGVEDYPTWSLDGGRVAYESDQSGNWDIWVAQVGGGDPVNLTKDNEGDDRFPSWSPDGQQIAFVTEEQTRSLFTMSAVGGRPREIRLPSDSSIQGQYSLPQWSADGSEIAVAVRRATGKVIAIVSLESLETRHVSIPPQEAVFSADLSWSPDGQTFAYLDSPGNADVTRLWLIASAGGEPTPVTDGRTMVFSPRWPPTGAASSSSPIVAVRWTCGDTA